MINGKLFVTTQEAADALGINPRTMLRWLRKGSIELKYGAYKGEDAQTIPLDIFVHPVNGYYYLAKENLDALLETLSPGT